MSYHVKPCHTKLIPKITPTPFCTAASPVLTMASADDARTDDVRTNEYNPLGHRIFSNRAELHISCHTSVFRDTGIVRKMLA